MTWLRKRSRRGSFLAFQVYRLSACSAFCWWQLDRRFRRAALSSIIHPHVLDPQAAEILGLYFEFGTVEIVLPCGVANPTRLACADSVLYFAESGTAILHALSVQGEPLGQFDLSSLGIGEITGIGSENASPDNDFLWIADSTQKVCFKIGPLLDFSQCLAEVDISTAPVVSDLTNGFDYASVSCWLCFGDGNPQVQLWDAAIGLAWSRDFSYCGIEGISLITEYDWGDPMEFLCVYDPSSSTIYGIYFGMGLEQGTWGSIKARSDN
jgi:hypothetical protein